MNKTIFILINLLAILSCIDSNSQTSNLDWKVITKYSISVDNVTYIFPSSMKKQSRDEYINSCNKAIKDNLSLIDETYFNDSILIEFLDNRQQMLIYSGVGGSGQAIPHRRAMFALTVDPPIKHELMHMISVLKWGYPPESCKWMNEGLATYAAGSCNGFTVEQIYTYLSANNMLISIEKLSENFYKNPEMIAYHQSGFLVEHLLKNYGLDKFKELWKKGMDNFENIYSFSFSNLTKMIEADLNKKYKVLPNINWTEFKKGCN
jgi:hypothetical protein